MMKRYKLWLIFFALLFILSLNVDAQKTKTKKPVKKTAQKTQVTSTKKPVAKTSPPTHTIAEDEKRVRDIVAFLQYLLNTLGSSGTSARDKEVLVKESYTKIFRDSKVQIEDDLDDERVVITNKDIVPYLKDVDFFFKDVKFEFTIEDIKSSTLPNGELFYKVSTTRALTGTTTEGKKITNTLPRYIEVNYHPEDQDLKIVSIYTNEINETEVLKNWWNELSLEWQTVLRKKLPRNNQTDSLRISDIKAITFVEELDLSNNVFIQDIEPLGRLINLKSLNLSGTRVNTLAPIRNLTELIALNLSHTKIADLSSLKYANKLISFGISHTIVTDISILEKMPALQNLCMSGISINDFSPITLLTELQNANLAATNITDLTPFENLTKITVLDISGTSVQDLNPLKNLKNITVLDIDSTHVSNINTLSNLENLVTLHANHTSISSLSALQKLTHLEKIYADHTGVNREAADNFAAVRTNSQVIFDTDNLKNWWDTLSPEWQSVFSKTAAISITPSKEEMAKVSHLDSINIGGNMRINSLVPLQKLQQLQVIIANQTGIHDLSPLEKHTAIRYLDISETEVSDISVLSQFTQLKILRADKSKIENMERYTLPDLEFFYADGTAFHDITAREFLEKNPNCLLIYKTVHLNRWWNVLTENWKNVFRIQMENDTTRESLHKLVEKEVLHFKDAPVTDLNALSEFIRLKELQFSGTSITAIPPLENIKLLTSLHATNGPIQQIESLKFLTSLEDLDISNTPIDDLKVMEDLNQLKTLNCSGTQIKRLDPLAKLQHLEYLDCSNTNAGKLDALDNLQLKTLKCYNTKISKRTIEYFKALHTDCNVMYYR